MSVQALAKLEHALVKIETRTPLRCPRCQKPLVITEYGTIREFACPDEKCGYTYDENVTDAQGKRRER